MNRSSLSSLTTKLTSWCKQTQIPAPKNKFIEKSLEIVKKDYKVKFLEGSLVEGSVLDLYAQQITKTSGITPREFAAQIYNSVYSGLRFAESGARDAVFVQAPVLASEVQQISNQRSLLASCLPFCDNSGHPKIEIHSSFGASFTTGAGVMALSN